MPSCQRDGTELLTLKAVGIDAHGPCGLESASPMGSYGSPLTMGLRRVFSTTRKIVLLLLIGPSALFLSQHLSSALEE